MRKSVLLLISVVVLSFAGYAQYCTPAVTNNGFYIFNISFSAVGGSNAGSANEGYRVVTGASSFTTSRYFFYSYTINTVKGPVSSYHYAVYADANQDEDFEDAGELLVSGTGTVGYETPNFYLSLHTQTGTIRLRHIVSANPITSPCGPVTGEVEDYIMTVPANTAPVLNTTPATSLPAMESGNTNSEGWPLTKLTRPLEPISTMITDADDQGGFFSNQAARGLAITGLNAPNGTWQFKTGAGSWTNISGVSGTNALLLLANGTVTKFDLNAMLRFVPTGTGTATLTVRAWDGTQGENGTYYNIGATGGSTAFSVNEETISLDVAANVTGGQVFSLSGRTADAFKTGLLNTATGAIAEAVPITVAGGEALKSIEAVSDAASNKIFWISEYGDIIYKADPDGSNAEAVVSGASYVAGLAPGEGNLLYYLDATDGLFAIDKSGGTATSLFSGNPGIADPSDIYAENSLVYNNGWLYFPYFSNNDGTTHFIRVKEDGSDAEELFTNNSDITAFDVKNGYLYWVDNDFADVNLYRMPVSGGAPELIANTNDLPYKDIIAVPSEGVVYGLVEYNGVGYSDIYSVDIATGTPTLVHSVNGEYSNFKLQANSSPLPVSLVSFNAARDGDSRAKLSWETSMEYNNDRFILERSEDGRNYGTVATVHSKGNGNKGHVYYWTDYLPARGNNFYRLWQVDLDGTRKELGVRMLRFGAGSSVMVFPNPGTGVFSLQFPDSKQRQLRVVNAGGVVVRNTRTNGGAQYRLDLSAQAPGIYVLILSDGITTEELKLAISR